MLYFHAPLIFVTGVMLAYALRIADASASPGMSRRRVLKHAANGLLIGLSASGAVFVALNPDGVVHSTLAFYIVLMAALLPALFVRRREE
jgi:hypothetical protein